MELQHMVRVLAAERDGTTIATTSGVIQARAAVLAAELFRPGDEEPFTYAGEQFVEMNGAVDPAVLCLCTFVDDLLSRGALIRALDDLITEMLEGIEEGDAAGVIERFLPEKFADRLTDRAAAQFFASAVALQERFERAGRTTCFAEEVVLRIVIVAAQDELGDAEGLTPEERDAAIAECRTGGWEISGDADAEMVWSRSGVVPPFEDWWRPWDGLPEIGWRRPVSRPDTRPAETGGG